MLTTILPLLALLSGCSPDNPAPASGKATEPTTTPPPGPAAPLTDAQVSKVLAPSPLGLQREVKEAGVAGSLASLVPQMPAAPPAADKDRVALRTGVVLAYTILGGPGVHKETFLAQLREVRAGMVALGTGAGLLQTIDNCITQVENDTASRGDFLQALDDVAGYAVPEEGWGPNDKTGPLLQAGAWLAGTQLVAKAVVASGRADAADKLLRRPEVPAYFLGYLKGEGATKAEGVGASLRATLTELDTLVRKPNLSLEDASAVVTATDGLLTLL